MIVIDENVFKVIKTYASYLAKEAGLTKNRIDEKTRLMLQVLHQNLGGMVSHRPSPYKLFGGSQGYKLYVYTDPWSKTQWGFAHEEFDDGNVIVRGMTNMKMIKEDYDDGQLQILDFMKRLMSVS